jgi:hypothetical protein
VQYINSAYICTHIIDPPMEQASRFDVECKHLWAELEDAVRSIAQSSESRTGDASPILTNLLKSPLVTEKCAHDAIYLSVDEGCVQTLIILLDHMSRSFSQGTHVHHRKYAHRVTQIDPKVMKRAILRGRCDIVQILLSYGIKPESDDMGWCFSSEACENDAIMVQILLENGCNVDAGDERGRTTLMKCAWKGQFDTVLILLARGAEVNLRDHGEKTALHYAAVMGHARILSSLITNGANIMYEPNHGLDLRDHIFRTCCEPMDRGSPAAHKKRIGYEECLKIIHKDLRDCKIVEDDDLTS